MTPFGDLFEARPDRQNDMMRPLADRMRPKNLSELIGQEHLTKKGSLLEQSVVHDRVFSMILWGPPGCGKTTLADIIANRTKSNFVKISAVLAGVKDVRQIIDSAQEQKRLYNKRTLLFVDEIHRFNKAQQDAFLHHVENGLITLIGATTENPSFEVIPALVSRCRVFVLNSLKQVQVTRILERAVIDKKNGLGWPKDRLTKDAYRYISHICDGDARIALANLETTANHFHGKHPIDIGDIESIIDKKSLRHDKAGEEHFNLISAFIKSMRGSDPDAALYWLVRMLQAGDDPYYLLRRMVRFATEDIGLADPGALTMVLNAADAFRTLGSPEGDDALAQAAIYLATAPKSNAVYKAFKKVRQTIDQTGFLPVPKHIRNAPTQLMKQTGYGDGYKYAHDYAGGVAAQIHLPDELADKTFYSPTGRGYEQTIGQRMAAWKRQIKKDET